ncbi:MAG: DUF1735 domain-containing protein [Niabella sp.]
MKKNILYISALAVILISLVIHGCKKKDENFAATPSDGIFITPVTSGQNINEVSALLASEPTTVDFGISLYRAANADVSATVGMDEDLVSTYNQENSTSYQSMPDGSFSFSTENVTIAKGEQATDTLQLLINGSLLEEDVSYLLPLKIKSVSGDNIILDESISVQYFVITGELPNIALGKSTEQSSTNASAVSSLAVDGNVNGSYSAGSVSHTAEGLAEQWWQVDLGGVASRIKEINIYNRTDCCGVRLSNYYIFISETPFESETVAGTLAQEGVSAFFQADQAGSPTTISIEKPGRYVRVQLSTGTLPLAIAELEVYGVL